MHQSNNDRAPPTIIGHQSNNGRAFPTMIGRQSNNDRASGIRTKIASSIGIQREKNISFLGRKYGLGSYKPLKMKASGGPIVVSSDLFY